MSETTDRFEGRAPPAALYYALAGPTARTSSPASTGLRRHSAGGRLWRLQRALPAFPLAGSRLRRRCVGRTQGGSSLSYAADIAANARRGKNAAGISPIALEAVRRIDVLFEIERGHQWPEPPKSGCECGMNKARLI